MSTLARALSLISAIFMLTACGGGGSAVSRDNTDNGSGDDGTTTPTYSIALTLENESGTSDNNLSENNSLFAVATVTDDEGNPYSDALLTFTLSNEELAEFGNDTGTARTNSSGVARIRLNASTASGDGEITAALSSGETGSTTFSATAVSATEPTTISVALSLQNESGEADNNLSSSNALTAVATVTNSLGEPQADLLLTFSLSNDELATFSNDTATALTNAEGVATIAMSVGSASGDGEVTATLPTGETDSTTFSSEGSTTVSEEPASLELFASSIQLASSGNDEIELIALVKNEQSVLMEGVDVSFFAPASEGVEINLTQPVTQADGTARAIVSSQNNAENRVIKVMAQVGSLPNEEVEIEVKGTEVTANGPSSVILNKTAIYVLRVVDSDGNTIPNEEIIITPNTEGTFEQTELTTDANGQVEVVYNAIASGQDQFEIEALGASDIISIIVQEDNFDFTETPESEISLNTVTTLTGRWLKDNSPVANRRVLVTASRGQVDYTNSEDQTFETDANGVFTFSLSSNNAGFSSVTASGLDPSGESVEVVSTVDIEFIADEPFYINADATPDIVGPDGQSSRITAIVRDENDNLVKNQVVSFNVDDPSTGTISPSQAVTDSNGVASTVFTSGAVSSNESVVVTAQVVGTPEVQDQAILTVANRSFDISLGTGNQIEEADTSSYRKEFAVFVSDSAGQPVSDVNLTASIAPMRFPDLPGYIKGFRVWNGTVWTSDPSQGGRRFFCVNEDVNNNGILDVTSTTTEDRNGDNLLTPGIVGAISFVGESVSDENGQATLVLRYPQNYGGWLQVIITVNGQSTGSEAQASMEFLLETSADDLSDEAVPPPPNPFGVLEDCTSPD
ncbi:Ig-like domain-containing protein [Alteromonas macleodii]|uniref:Invasin n=1 Tax=Alteromonas macleodii TaxID=28108 RepID=A0A6T9Y1N2_ALTMA|nr:Ig-like domain-containing protein [Alteromonas macleodii]CAB9493620.1 Invasin [Alteromonas macleodii]